MKRFLLFLGVVLASCKSGGAKPATVGNLAAASSTAGIAKPLRGPFATLDEYCETRPKTDEYECASAEVAPMGALPTGLLEAAAIYESKDDSNHDIGCSVALRTAAGWFVGPASAETCREPSYIELQGIDIDTDSAVAAITFGVNWHTKNGDDEASYKLTALCGTDGGGVPACTPVFVSQCDARAPVSGCNETSFALTWKLDGDSATFTPDRPIDNESVPTGTQRIVGGR